MIYYDLPKSGELEQNLWQNAGRLDAGDLFKLGVSHSFERETTIGLVMEESRIMDAEKEAGTYDPLYGLNDPVLQKQGHDHAISKEEWEESPFYREKIEYTDAMTPQRAQILAEIHDRRKHEKELIARSADTFGRKAMLFGASFLAQLPDPINFIPVGGAIAKGGSLGSKVLRGAREGALSTALADAVIFPVANQRGEDFSFFDAAMDITFGALIGGGIGAVGHKFSQWRDGREAAAGTVDQATTSNSIAHGPAAFDTSPDRFYELAPAQERRLDLAEALEEIGFSRSDAEHYGNQADNALRAKMDEREYAWDLRQGIGGEERAKAGLLLDRAMLAVERGEAPDIAAWGLELGISHPLELSGRLLNVDPLVSEARPLWKRDMPFEEMLPLAEDYWMKNYAPRQEGGKQILQKVRTDNGEVFFKGVKGWKKYIGKISPEKLRLIPFLDEVIKAARWGESIAPRRDTHQKQGVRIHPLQAYVNFDGRVMDVRITVREAPGGKFFYDLGEIDVRKKTTPPEPSGGSAASGSKGGESAEGGAYLGPKTFFQRQADQIQGGSSVASNPNMEPIPGNVNLQVSDITPDMAPARPLPEFRAPEPPKGQAEELKAMGIDPKTGQSFDELELRRLNDEGRVVSEDAAVFESIVHEGERINKKEDIALSLISCSMGVIK